MSEEHYIKRSLLICTVPNIIRVFNSRNMKWVERVALMGERKVLYRFLVGKPEGKRQLGRSRIILRWIFRKWNGEAWTGLIWLRMETGDRLLFMP